MTRREVIIRALRHERANLRIRLKRGTHMSAERRQQLEFEAQALDDVLALLTDEQEVKS